MSKKIISFLGTGKYQKCIYNFKHNQSTEVTYIQDAIAQVYAQTFGPEDSICIFLTPEARETHWENLKKDLMNLKLECKIVPIDIEYSKTEAAVWNLFSKLYEAIEPEDKIFFDVTHSFRYLPMIFFSILKYAQYLKNIKVQKILYGAFEARDEETNIAPVFDLTNAYKVLKWAEAAEEFNKYGSTTKLESMTQSNMYKSQKPLIENIVTLSKDLNATRCMNITRATNFVEATEQIDSIKENDKNDIFYPILQTIYSEVSQFKANSTLNFIPAVQWYIDREMINQAYVMLKEGIDAYVMAKFNLNYNDKDYREWFSKGFSYYKGHNKLEIEKFSDPAVRENFRKCINSTLFKELKPVYFKIATDRNDIEHGGYCSKKMNYSDPEQAGSKKNQIILFDNLINNFNKVKEIIARNEN